MAIKKKKKSDVEFTFDDMYIKIFRLRIDVERNRIVMEIEGFANKEAREKDKVLPVNRVLKDSIKIDNAFNVIKAKDFSIDSIYKACYDYLKTLDEYSGGEDI